MKKKHKYHGVICYCNLMYKSRVCVRACVRACVHACACVRACVRACVCVRASGFLVVLFASKCSKHMAGL